jgi:1-acyl-sn-glycerol-3-phosphate acyltransferase
MQKKLRKIYEYTLGYYLLGQYAYFLMRIYYRKIYVRGRENVPKNAPVIFAPNHKNALMDPMLILCSFPKEQITFMARGDVFSNPILAKILRYLKILPIFRMRDGFGNLDKNEEPFEEAIDILKNGYKLCLMPEGVQVEKRALLPLVKGMFRIGFHAQEKFGKETGVRIVPVGIEYEDLHHSGKNVQIQFGKPIELSDYFDLYTENQPLAYNALREDLWNKINELVLNIPSKEYYKEIYLQTLLETDNYLKTHNLKNNIWNKLFARQEIAKKYTEMEETNPSELMQLQQKLQPLFATGKTEDEIFALMQKTTAWEWLKIVSLSPLFLCGWIFLALPYAAIKHFTHKLLNSGFYSSISYFTGLFFPFFFLVYFLVGWIFMPFAWSVLIFLVVAPTVSVIAFRLKNLYVSAFERIFFAANKQKTY